MNRERLIKIIEDLKECRDNINECLSVIDNEKENNLMIKLAKSSLRDLFVSFHTILEDLCSILLKELKKYRIGISLSESLDILNKEEILSEDLYMFLQKSRMLRNRIAHRYKEPTHEQLYDHILRNINKLDDVIKVAENYIK